MGFQKGLVENGCIVVNGWGFVNAAAAGAGARRGDGIDKRDISARGDDRLSARALTVRTAGRIMIGRDNRMPDDRYQLPQLVTSDDCFACDVCCRFPEQDSPLAPYFTPDEIKTAVARGVAPERFSDPGGCRIELVRHPTGPGYLCPAFDPASNGCRIYADRPLDCRLYPFVVMHAPDGRATILGADRKCPVVQRTIAAPATEQLAVALRAQVFETHGALLRANPGLIGPYQRDVISLGAPAAAFDGDVTALGLTPFEPADEPFIRDRLLQTNARIAAHAWFSLTVWRDLFRYYWAVRDGALCLFAQYVDGLYLPLPPAPFSPRAVDWAWRVLEQVNGARPVARIENLARAEADRLAALGFRTTPSGNEYLYPRTALERLAGNRYKSQRAAINRFTQAGAPEYSRFQPGDLTACRYLFQRWQATRLARATDSIDRAMLEDAAAAHARLMGQAFRPGLELRVLRQNRRVVGYTAGYAVSPDTFCVAFEITDLERPGAAAYLFREFCREQTSFDWINTMGDCELGRLRRAKLAYRPAQVIELFSAARARTS